MIFEWSVRKKLFRNINHALWFMMSMYMLMLVTAYYFYPGLKTLILFPIIVHLVAFIQAVYSNAKKLSSETISEDCRWWNLFMVLVYAAMFCIIGIA